jgi:23S rRNA pseudouridine955/2504/2580 synthase
MLRKKNITLNGKKATGNEMLLIGDEISVFFSDETFDKMRGISSELDVSAYILQEDPLDIVYENDDFIAINKPKNMLSQKAKDTDVSLNEYVLSYLLKNHKMKAEDLSYYRPSCINRLDRNTTGLIFAAKTYKGAKELSLLFKEKNHPKVYRCICAGEIKEEQLLKHFLCKDEETNTVRITSEVVPKAKEIITGIKPIKSNGKITLLEVKLYTGRTHQIRAHLSYINHPVIGDYKYGNDSINKEYKTKYSISSQMLHSFAMDIPEIGELTAAVPEEFEKVFH